MHLRILSSVLLIEIFHLRDKELKHRKIAPESLQKLITELYEVAGDVWVDL